MIAVSVGLPVQDAAAEDASAKPAERLTIAGRQRMLAEGMAAKLCLATSGVDPEHAQGELYVMWNVFNWYHAGIRWRNPQLQLTAERDDRVHAAWQAMDRRWAELRPLHERQLDQSTLTAEDFAKAMRLTGEITESASTLVASLRSAYADKLGPQGFGAALLIDLYERQRMLAHQITKQVCLTTYGRNSADDLAALSQEIGIFVLSLDAFQKGRADAGVPPPPSAEIAELLAAARAHWQPVEPIVRYVAAGNVPRPAQMTRIATAMDRFIAEMTGALNALVADSQAKDG